jgi:hypothetical protein
MQPHLKQDLDGVAKRDAGGRRDHSEEKQSDSGQRKEWRDTREKEREWGEAENRAIMARAQQLSPGR